MTKQRFSLITARDKFIIGTISFSSGIIAVFDAFGFLDDIPIINNKIPNIILFLLAALTGYVAFTQPEKEEAFQKKVSENIDRIFGSLNTSRVFDFKIRSFNNIAEATEYATKRISKAKQQVIVIYPELNSVFYNAVPSTVFYKQFFVLPEHQLLRLRKLLPQSLSNMPRNYSFATLRLPKELFQDFIIVDNKEVIIFSKNMPSTTKNHQFIKIYRENFDEIWDKAIKLKTNDRIHADKVDFVLTLPRAYPETPENLEECVKQCLKEHEKNKK